MGEEAGGKKLFVCTKPYQYLIARLIKQGCGFEYCDLVILNHFYKAEEFSDRVRETGVWGQVIYIDDGMLDQMKLQLNPIKKYFFYHSWRKFLPTAFLDISAYSEVFVAHDFVALEYAIIRKFSSESKSVILYEEGSGNYINNSTHKKWYMRFLKRVAPWFGLPGGYFGSLKWIKSIWLQRPELITANRNNPIYHKTRGLPITLEEFMRMPDIMSECYQIYPELHDVDKLVRDHDELTVILTDPFLDEITDRKAYIHSIIEKATEAATRPGSPIFFKQHPGETIQIEASITSNDQVAIMPQKLPIELLYLIIQKNKISKINLISFGSTAILNLYDLCRSNDYMSVFIIESMSMDEELKLIASRFVDLAEKHQIQFQTL
ncbi:polysialyltransferase family glycosyltransferase [Cohnella abietis]|uniref:Capsular polysaccharide biosynthesis protein n=1 Tax=Cohnella abietis TaxID=2507935 RepID=A0A3T1D104_9BACL|nr:polysialyltransferase family glycosyltransferase [Cohnella abietis]BBI31787.1 hypothetical protein KCTCHS21_11860 [Cohnella abietis]